jgi:hypothetical protein
VSSRAWDWVALSFFGFVVAFIATVPVILFVEQALGLAHVVGLASWTVSQVLLSGAVTLVLGRLLLRPKARAGVAAWVVLGIGAAVSASVWVTLLWWSVMRHGYFEVDQVGITSYLYAAVAGVAVAGFATLVAPPVARRPPWIGTVIATVVTALTIATNVPGALDGIAPESIPLAIALGVALAYAVVVMVMTGIAAGRPWRRGADSHAQTGGRTLDT